jgi:hypothetical protein
MKRLPIALVAGMVLLAGAFAWHYVYSIRHATLQISVHDTGLRTQRRLYQSPHDVRLSLHDASGKTLAQAHSVEPSGYILPIHPDAHIGDCRQYENPAAGRMRYAECYNVLSLWFPGWVPHVHSAHIVLPACEFRTVAVKRSRYRANWWMWWVPLPHMGGSQRDHFTLEMTIDSSRCERPL